MTARGLVVLAALGACGRLDFDPLGSTAGSGAITWHATTTALVPMTGSSSVTIPTPPATADDVWIAVLAMGNTGVAQMPVFTPPAGWTQLARRDRDTDTALALYLHVAAATEPASATWDFGDPIEGVAWISAYGGVATAPTQATDDGQVIETAGPTYATPAIGAAAGSLVIATYATHSGTAPTWTAPAGTTTRAAFDNGTTRSGLGVDTIATGDGAAGPFIATVSSAQDYAIVDILALEPR